MFGHHDDKPQDDAQLPDTAVDGVINETGDGAAPQDSTASDPGSAGNDGSWSHPGAPLDTSPQPVTDVLSPAGGFPRSTGDQVLSAPVTPTPAVTVDEPATEPAPSAPEPDLVTASDTDISNLINIKHMALEELLPLIDKLDQTPEERFRTVMMMIQASDNKDLIDKAYESAHKITDEKARAQALLDIVNEINYFTANHEA